MWMRGARRDGRSREAKEVNVADNNSEVLEAGRAESYGASWFLLSQRSLKLIISEEICGRFGSFDGSTSSYRAGSDGPFGF
jgi:hypothetical protein